MKNIKFFILNIISLVAINSHAQELCLQNKSPFTELIEASGQKCLNHPIDSTNLSTTIFTDEELLKLCSHCSSDILNQSSLQSEARAQNKNLVASAVLNEFQKNLSLMALDLMKLRSSFKLDFDPAPVAKACDFSRLKTPSCLNEGDQKLFKQQTQIIANSMASEMFNLLSPQPNLESGLFTRTSIKNQCQFTDREILYSQMRYQESLLTPDFINDLKNLSIPDGTSIEDFLNSRPDKKRWLAKIKQFKNHPLIDILFLDTTKLNQFISQFPLSLDNKMVIEKLYSSESAKDLAKSLQKRCEDAFTKTTVYLEKIYCAKDIHYVANNIQSIENLENKSFSNLRDEDAEPILQQHCALINNKSQGKVDFSSIQKDLNSHHSTELIQLPFSEFKIAAYNANLNTNRVSICSAKNGNPDCATNETSSACQMLKFIEQSRTDEDFKHLARSSNENIDPILRSLIGPGKPSNEEHRLFLEKEGIFPGTMSTPIAQVSDVKTFHQRMGKNATPTSPVGQSPQEQSGPSTMTPDTAPFVPKDHSPSERNTASKSNSKKELKNLNESETATEDYPVDDGDEILRRLRRNAENKMRNQENNQKRGSPSHSGASDTDSLVPETRSPSTSMAKNGDSTLGPKVPLAEPQVTSRGGGQIQPAQSQVKNDSYNSALMRANEGREGTQNQQVKDTLQVIQTNKGQNEIHIKIAEAELQNVDKFTEKLKNILISHSENFLQIESKEKFVIHINEIEIDVSYNQNSQKYQSVSRKGTLPSGCLLTIDQYFNTALKVGPGKREALIELFKVSADSR